MMRILTVLLLGIFVLSIGSLVLADENKDHVCFRALDTNQDGQVTLQEFERFYKDATDRFKAADADKDGKLSHGEYHDSLGHGST
jgi:Ca2+-binding EF-hand superfamily protein